MGKKILKQGKRQSKTMERRTGTCVSLPAPATHTLMQMVKINPNITVIKICVNKSLSIREFQIRSLECLALLFMSL